MAQAPRGKKQRAEYTQDNKASNSACPQCGNSTQVHVTIPVNQGRVFCPHCTWDDSKPRTQHVAGNDPRKLSGRGVEIIGLNETGGKGVTIVGGSR